MPRFFIGWLLGLAGNAIGLILAAIILPDDQFAIELFSLSFFWAVLIFAIVSAFFTFIVFKFLMRNAGSIVALTGLISTFLALLITSLISDGLSISGMGWVWGTLIVWICGMFIWLLPGPWRAHRKERRG
jgi:Mycobacterial 4 TMS phage holin, superfamily IV